MLIYMVTNRINGKSYVGQTVQSLRQRKRGHINGSKCKRNNMYISKAIRKHGQNNFDWEILHDNIINIDDLNRLEIFYIGYYDTFGNGYNLTKGGRNALLSKEHKRKLSEAHKGKVLSDEHKRKIKASAKKGRYSHMYNRKILPETLKRMAEGQKGKRYSEETKRKMSKNSGVAIQVVINGKCFNTITAASLFIGVTCNTIKYRISHKTKWLNYKYDT